MIFPNIFKSYSIRHYASADANKVILGIKLGMIDEIKITLSTKRFLKILKQLNNISDKMNYKEPEIESVKKSKQINT